MKTMAGIAAVFVSASCGQSTQTLVDGALARDAAVDGSTVTDAPVPIDSDIGGGPGRIRGTVWAPGQGPGQVPFGYEIPVPNALVYLSTDYPPDIPQRAHCEQCRTIPVSTRADAKGHFEIANIATGEYILVIEKGQFRVEQSIQVSETPVELLATQTTLPNTHEPNQGRWIPKMAIATGRFDKLENILGKMGIGGSASGNGTFVPAPGVGGPDSQIHFYINGGRDNLLMSGTLGELVGDLERMLDYHIIFIPCGGNGFTPALYSPQTLQNIRDYVAAGGKLYVADWSGEWADNVFPAQIELGGGVDTPAAAYDAASGTWNINLFGDANGLEYHSYNAEVVDSEVYAWLDGQLSSHPFDTPPGAIDASHFAASDIWNVIEATHAVDVGDDMQGNPVIDVPRVLVEGGRYSDLPKKPLSVTYEPAGCGRVIYSAAHTANHAAHTGLYPQERILIYLIMEIGSCVQTIIID